MDFLRGRRAPRCNGSLVHEEHAVPPGGTPAMNTVRLSQGVVASEGSEVVRTPTDVIRLRLVTGGNVQVVEYESEDRHGPPPHRHAWDEIEYVLEGNVEFWLDGTWIPAGPGAVQSLPAGAAHSVRVPAGRARLLMVTIGPPYDGFAREMAALATGPAPSLADLVAAAHRHGVILAE